MKKMCNYRIRRTTRDFSTRRNTAPCTAAAEVRFAADTSGIIVSLGLKHRIVHVSHTDMSEALLQ